MRTGKNRQGSEVWDCSPVLAAGTHQPFGCMALQCSAVIPSQVLVHKLLLMESGQLPSAAGLWGCGAAAAEFAAEALPCAHVSMALWARGQTPCHV